MLKWSLVDLLRQVSRIHIRIAVMYGSFIHKWLSSRCWSPLCLDWWLMTNTTVLFDKASGRCGRSQRCVLLFKGVEWKHKTNSLSLPSDKWFTYFIPTLPILTEMSVSAPCLSSQTNCARFAVGLSRPSAWLLVDHHCNLRMCASEALKHLKTFGVIRLAISSICQM